MLYLGMAADILAPLLINPKIEKIFVIDNLMPAFASKGTWESQKDDIRQYLINGSDEGSYSREIFIEDSDDKSFHYLAAKSTIVSDYDDGKVWRLSFKYNGRIVDLVFYHHRNFLKEWPDEVRNINQILMMGSFSWDGFIEPDYYEIEPDDYETGPKTIIQMLESRTTKPFEMYALAFNHPHFPNKLTIKNGQERSGTKIAMISINDTSSPDWIDRIYPIEYLLGADLNDFK